MKKREKVEPESAVLSAWHVKGSLKIASPTARCGWLAKAVEAFLSQPTLFCFQAGFSFPLYSEDRNVLSYRSLENHFVRDPRMQTALFARNIERTIEMLTL